MITYDDVARWPIAAHAVRQGIRPADAEDAAQEALLYLIDRDIIGRWDPARAPLVAWVWTVIRLRFRTFIERNYGRTMASLDALRDAPGEEEAKLGFEPSDPEAEAALRGVELGRDLDLVRQYLQSAHHSERSRIQLADFFASLVRRAEGEIVSADVFAEWGEHTRQAVGNAKVRLRAIPEVAEVLRR